MTDKEIIEQNKFRAKIRSLIKRHTNNSIAESIGISPSTFSSWLGGSYNFNSETLNKIKEYFSDEAINVKIEDII